MSDFDAGAHDEFYKSLLGDFLGESEHLLVALNENLLRLEEWTRLPGSQREKTPAGSLLGELFRAAHSLKGLSNMLGLEEIERLVHHIELVLNLARKDRLPVTVDVVRLLFEAIDRLGNLIDALKDLDAPAVDYESVLEQMAELLGSVDMGPEAAHSSHAERTLRQIESQVAEALSGMDAASAAQEPPEKPSPRDGETPAGSAPPDDRIVYGPETVSRAAPTARPEGENPFDGLTDDADLSSRFIPIFIDETELALDQLTETLLEFENGGSRGEIRSLLVISHRIKGSAASVGLNRCAKLAHFMEDLLQDLSETGQGLSPDVTDAMLKCVDELRNHVEGLKQGSIPADDFPQLAVALLQARQAAATASKTPATTSETAPQSTQDKSPCGVPPSPPAVLASQAKTISGVAPQPTVGPAEEPVLVPISPGLRQNVIATAPMGIPAYVGVATFQPNLALVGLKAELLYEKLSNLGDVCYFDPPPKQLDTIEKLDYIQFGLATERSERQIRATLKTAGVLGAIVEPLLCSSSSGPSDVNAACSPIIPDSGPRDGKAPDGSRPQVLPPDGVAPAAASAVSVPKAPSGKKDADRMVDTSNKPTETLRVDVDRLDQLMNLAGQLVVSKARFAQISDLLRSMLGNKRSVLALGDVLQSLASIADLETESHDRRMLEAELGTICGQARRIHGQLDAIRREVESFHQMHASINELEEAVHQLDRVADDIQKNIMDTRMVPIGPLFARFHRVIRDITRAANDKAIRLVIHGENTELDKRMIDELGDPLIHLIRNSADHGIEPSDARARAGKPAEGTIILDAFHRGNNVLIQISDDGRGLDPDRILAKALERGLLTSRDAERMTTQQILQLIWQPGFSTAEQVTEVSGRGVGMDIVRTRVESLNGSVELDSMPGCGMAITIKLPLTLAILPSLMVEVSGDVFAMPMESVLEIIRVGPEDIATVHGKRTAQVRGRVVSVLDLDEIFQWKNDSLRSTDRCGAQSTLVIVGDGEEEIALVIDRVLGEEDVVIKSMTENYKNVPGIAGASVLGSGRVSLILDLAAVIAMAGRPTVTQSAVS